MRCDILDRLSLERGHEKRPAKTGTKKDRTPEKGDEVVVFWKNVMFEKYTVRKAVISTDKYYYDNCTRLRTLSIPTKF